MKGDPKVIAILRQAVGAETQSEAQWCQDAAWLARIGLHGLSDYILTEAAEEHATVSATLNGLYNSTLSLPCRLNRQGYIKLPEAAG